MSNRLKLLALLQIADLGIGRVSLLLDAFGSPEAVFDATSEELMAVVDIDEDLARGMVSAQEEDFWALDMELVRYEDEYGFRFVARSDPEYPTLLRRISDPPLFLWARGSLAELDDNAVAVIGSRRPTSRALRNARWVGHAFADRGITVVSGLAAGVDTAAHRGAIEAGGRTVAVLGSGIGRIIPEENEELAEEIAADRGAIISERVQPGAFPSRDGFFARNRIITGMSRAAVVIEAEEDSGSMDAGLKALEQGRPLLVVVPEHGLRPGSEQLLDFGALPVETMEEVWEVLEQIS